MSVWRPGSKLGDLIERIRPPKPQLELEVAPESAQRSSVTAAEAEAVIDQKAPELVATAIERLRADHAAELGQAERLLRQLAITEIRADFESIYARIYGSQVVALRTLRAAPDGAARAAVEAPLAEAKHEVSTRLVVWLQSLPFDEWFGYLRQQGLAEVDAEQRYRITTAGA